MKRLTTLPFPAYRFVPGVTPHPRSSPQGHSFGDPEPECQPLLPDRWWECQNYLFAWDLFNHAYYWEAHEQWEAVWIALERRGFYADFLKGLIKMTAMGVKVLEKNATGFQRHQRRAMELQSQTSNLQPQCLGIDVEELRYKVLQEDYIEAAAHGRLTVTYLPTRTDSD